MAAAGSLSVARASTHSARQRLIRGDGQDEINDPGACITGSLDGEVMQDGNTSDMIFSVAELIAFLSQDTTLLPGTVDGTRRRLGT